MQEHPLANESLPCASDLDESAASEARARYRAHGIEAIESDERIRRVLAPDERVLAFRRAVALDRHQASAVDSFVGDLYVTSRRLVLLGPPTLSIDIEDIEDAALAGERLLLDLRNGVDIAVVVDRPRLLRVQVAVARAARAGRPGRRRGQPQAASR